MLRTTSSRSARAIAPALMLSALAGYAAADGPEIARIAPENALVVVSVPSWPELRQAALRGNLGRLWDEPRITTLVKDALEKPTKQFTSFLTSINVDPEDIEHPTGHIGAAILLPTSKNGKAATNSDPFFLIVADFGEHADDWRTLIDRYIDRGLDDRTLTTEDDSYRDVDITVITPVYLEDPHANCADACSHEPGLAETLGGTFKDQRSLTFARIDNSFIFTNNLETLELAIERASGQGREAMADSDDYRDAVDRLERGGLAHAIILTGPMLDMVFEEEGTEVRRIFDLVGMSALRAIGTSLRLDTVDAVAELAVSIILDEKAGIFELMDEPGAAFEPPAFVPQGAASVSRLSFRFDRVLQKAREIVQALPGDERNQVAMMLDQASGIAGPLLDAMGPTIYAVNTYGQPYSAQSSQMLYAFEVRDEMTITNTIDFLIGQAGGMVETREFDGTVIYFSEMMPVELAAAVGFGRLFVGSPAAVENALRAAGQPDAPRLVEEPRFRAAMRPLSDTALGYSFTDMSQWLRWQWWAWQNADKILAEALDNAGIDGAYRDEILRQSREETPDWQKDLPPVETVTRHLGDMVYELRSVDEGFSGRVLILKPREP